jgi:hypothetical protein
MSGLLQRLSHLLNRLSCRVLAGVGWVVVEDTGVWRYLENSETGERHALRVGPGDAPLDHLWLVDTRTINLDGAWREYDR